ncbi:MAG: hypothetical protein J6L05_06085 [Ruminococcus sp.]|nr:hypothetical protein [Ruminococcus sp.]
MTLCRIDDADNIHVTYKRKVANVIWGKVALSVGVLLLGWFVSLFVGLGTETNLIGIVWLITFVLIGLLIVSGYIKMVRNANYFTAYLIDDKYLYRVDLSEAFGNDTLFGKSFSLNSRNGVFQREKIAKNMRKVRSTSHFDEFICRRDVVDYSGYQIEDVMDISDSKEFLRVKLQMKGFLLMNSYSRKKTVYIPKTFTNFFELRQELEKLM